MGEPELSPPMRTINAPNPGDPASDRRKGRPTAHQTEQLNQAIIRAALKVFTREGFAAATNDMIANEAGTTRRSVSHRFTDKSALLIAAIELFGWEYRQTVFLPTTVPPASPLEAVKRACRTIFDRATADDFVAFYRLIIAECARNPAAGRFMVRFNDEFADQLEELVVRAQEQGYFGRSRQKPSVTATGLIGAFLSNPLNRRAFEDIQFKEDARRNRYFDDMWELVAHSSTNAPFL